MNMYMIELIQGSDGKLTISAYIPKEGEIDFSNPTMSSEIICSISRAKILSSIMKDQTGFEPWSSLHVTPFCKDHNLGFRVFVHAREDSDIRELITPCMQWELLDKPTKTEGN